MACGGFTCSKNSLIFLNVIYIVVAFVLIIVASLGTTANYITSVKIVGGIIACGVFLLFVAILGIFGAVKHNQVLLFFYMIVLFLLFLLQFGFACACLAVTEHQQEELLRSGWRIASNSTKEKAQNYFACCGFDQETQYNNQSDPMGHPPCIKIEKCCAKNSNESQCCYEPLSCKCSSCISQLKESFESALRASGGIGLFFSFTEFIGVWLTVRYRNQKDPRANPGAFL